MVWDGAPCHWAKVVRQVAGELGITLVPLPGYSPDLNPIKGPWKGMREEVTQHHCHATVRDLFDACKCFIDAINESLSGPPNASGPGSTSTPKSKYSGSQPELGLAIRTADSRAEFESGHRSDINS